VPDARWWLCTPRAQALADAQRAAALAQTRERPGTAEVTLGAEVARAKAEKAAVAAKVAAGTALSLAGVEGPQKESPEEAKRYTTAIRTDGLATADLCRC
jgi:hypothetical protein